MNNSVADLKAFFTDLSNEDYSESLEAVMVAYEIQQEIFNGADAAEYYGLDKAKQVTSIFQAWLNDNLFNPDKVTSPDASFKECADKILSVGLNY